MVKSQSFGGFRISFLVDARGGCMQSMRYPKLRIFIPPKAVSSPNRIILQLLVPEKRKKIQELNGCDGLVSRILKLESSCVHFLKPILIELPHIASQRDSKRQLVILTKVEDNQVWKEFTGPKNAYNLNEIFSEFRGMMTSEEEIESRRICKIFIDNTPNYFCLVSRLEFHSTIIGQDGGVLGPEEDNRVKIRFPPNALTKNVQISLQVQIIEPKTIADVLGDLHDVSVSPIITLEPKGRKFRDQIDIQMPLPNGVQNNNLSNLRVLYNISKFDTFWEDVTNSTLLSTRGNLFIHSTKISGGIWLISAPGVEDATDLADRIYSKNRCVPFIGRFIAFARRNHSDECLMCLVLIDEDSEESCKASKLLQGFLQISSSSEVEVKTNVRYQIEVAGNLVPVGSSSEDFQLYTQPFEENRTTFTVKIRNYGEEFCGKIAILDSTSRKDSQSPIAILNIDIPKFNVYVPQTLNKENEYPSSDGEEYLSEIEDFMAMVKTYEDDIDSYNSRPSNSLPPYSSITQETKNNMNEGKDSLQNHANGSRTKNEIRNMFPTETESTEQLKEETKMFRLDEEYHIDLGEESDDVIIPISAIKNDSYSHISFPNDEGETYYSREIIKNDPQIQIDSDILSDGRIRKRKVITSNITILERNSGMSWSEENQVLRMKSNEPIDIIEKPDGSILKRTTTTTTTTRRITLNDTNPSMDEQCLFSNSKELNDILYSKGAVREDL